jgi:flagellar motor switch protein FliN/FliY
MSNAKILDANVVLDVVIGSTECPVKKLAKITEGTVIELESLAGEPVQLRASGKLIGYGEVVVIDEQFGIRVTKVGSKEDDDDKE